jgi:hypothetical protein
MKKLILLLLAIFLTPALFAQSIHYEKSFQTALAKAAARNKLVFLEIDLPKPLPNFTSGLEDEEVAKKFNSNFINYRLTIADTAANQFRRKYQVNIFPAYLFIDKNGYMIYREDKDASLPKRYLIMADAALKQAASGKNLSDYDAQYQKGKYDVAFLKEYINLREKLGIYDNAKLIDQYVNFLSISDLSDYQTVLFILKAGPYAYGKTYTLALNNRPVYDSIYKTEPAADRSAINGRIVDNTFKEAVRTKNTALAEQAANYSRNIRLKDYRQASIASTKVMLGYYLATKDTANYLRQASNFYDYSYMTISADSSKKLEEARRTAQMNLINSGRKIISADSMKKLIAKNGDKSTQFKQVFSTSTPAFNVANELNNAAYTFYTTGTVNPNYLSKAIIWSRRAILLNPIFAYYDTLAHLLYRYGFYAEAEADQSIAVNLAKQSAPGQSERMKQELEKIKKRTL